jgi:hypothetical protein
VSGTAQSQAAPAPLAPPAPHPSTASASPPEAGAAPQQSPQQAAPTASAAGSGLASPAGSSPASLGPIIATGADAGAPPLVKVFDAATGAEKFEFLAYDASFRGGVRVAAADLNGDGIPDVITAPGPGMAPEVKVFDGKTGKQLPGPAGDFLAYDASSRAGLYVAAADATGGGAPDILTGPGAGGGAQVRVFSGKTAALLRSFNAYGAGYESGLTVAAGYWPNMTHADIVTGTGAGVTAEVKVFDGNTGAPLPGPAGDLRPYGPAFTGGAFVVVGDVTGGGTPDILTGPGAGHAPEVKVFDGGSGAVLQDYLAGDPNNYGGVRVASTYIAGRQVTDVVTAGGPGSAPRVYNYSGATGQPLLPPAGGFLAYDASQLDGVFVAAAIDPTLTASLTPGAQTQSMSAPTTVTLSWSTDLPGAVVSGVSINWGDGSPPTNFPSPQPTSGAVTASHAYTTAGTYTVTGDVAATNKFQGLAVTVGAVAVVGSNDPPAIPPPDDTNCGCSNQPGDLIAEGVQLSGPVPKGMSVAPVRYFDGVIQLAETDLSSDGFTVPWGQTRSWTNGPGYAAGGSNGNGWVNTQLPHLLQADGSSNNSIVAVSNGTTSRYFDLVNGTYQPRFYDQSQLVYNSGSGVFVLTDDKGAQISFYDFSTNIPAAQRGQFKTYTDADGNLLTVTAHTTDGHVAEVQRTVTVSGTTYTDSYLYSYLPTGDPNAGLLANVTLRRQTNGGAWGTVRQVQYAYYNGTEPYGNLGDLKTVQVEDAASPNPNVLDNSYYRYYVSGEANGYQRGLKYVFNTQSYARLVAALGNSLSGLTDSQVAPYADNYFQYDSSQRVTKEVAQGLGCSACSGGLGTFTYAYTSSSNAPGPNSWAAKTVEGLPDGNQNIVYTNYAGQVMLSVYHDTTSGLSWETFYKYDSAGHLVLQAAPSAVTGYDDTKADLLNNVNGNYQYLSDNAGLVTVLDYYTTTTAGETTAGGVVGYQQDVKLQQGELGTPVPQETWQYYMHTAGGSSVAPVATDTVYRNTDGTGGETTTDTYTWFPGTLQDQSQTVSRPPISATQNGPGATNPDTETTYFDAYGREVWHKDGDGFLRYTAYDPASGAVVKTINDVDTTKTGDFTGLPTGWSTPTGGGLHLITQYQVDGLGRTTKQTSPAGNVTFTVYNDPNYEVLTYPGWNSATNMPTGPTQATREDRPGSYTETFTVSATPHLTNSVPDGTEAVSGLQTLSRQYTNAAGQMVASDSYFNLTGLTYLQTDSAS